MSKARRYVLYQDASVRWSDNFRTLFDRTELYGHQMVRHIENNRVPAHTLKQTFDYFGEEPCTFLPYRELTATCQFHKNDPLVIKAILEPWARCSLEKDCMCPVESMSVLHCNKPLQLHRCHRFDQSAITIIMAKVYGEDMYKFLSPERNMNKPQYVFIMKEHGAPNYFHD